MAQAKKRYSEFTGHAADEIIKTNVKWPKTCLTIGRCDGVLYTTIRDGEIESYIHKFRKKSAPDLLVSHDGKMLVLKGGDFTFTERGITDKGQ